MGTVNIDEYVASRKPSPEELKQALLDIINEETSVGSE
jgi:hypothetical protein